MGEDGFGIGVFEKFGIGLVDGLPGDLEGGFEGDSDGCGIHDYLSRRHGGTEKTEIFRVGVGMVSGLGALAMKRRFRAETQRRRENEDYLSRRHEGTEKKGFFRVGVGMVPGPVCVDSRLTLRSPVAL